MKTVAAAVALGGGMVYYARFLMFDDHTMIHLNAWWSSIKKRRDVVHNPTTRCNNPAACIMFHTAHI